MVILVVRMLLAVSLWVTSSAYTTGAQAAPTPSPSPQHGQIADEDWKLAPGEHVDLYFTAGSPAADDIGELKQQAEADFAKIANLLHLYFSDKIRIYLFPDKLKMPGFGGSMNVDSKQKRAYVLYDDDSKRNAPFHGGLRDDLLGTLGTVMMGTINENPSVLSGIGMIIYMIFPVSGREAPMKEAKQAFEAGKFVPLQEFDVVYGPQAKVNYTGAKALELIAFTKYLIETYGLDRFMWLFREAKPGQFSAALKSAIGRSLVDVERDFHSYVRSYMVVEPPKRRERPTHEY